MLSLLFYIFIALMALLLFFLPGYLFLRLYTSWEGPKLLSGSFGLSMALGSSLAFLGFFLPGSRPWFYAVTMATLLILLLVLASRRKKNLWPLPGIPRKVLLLFLAFYLSAFCYQALTPLYTGAGWYGDWWESYEIVNFYLGQRPPDMVFFEHDTIPSRPPAYHLLMAFPMKFFHITDDVMFFYLALFSVLPGMAFFWPAYHLAQRFLKGKALEIFPYLLIFSPFLAQSALYPWSKMLSGFYLLLAVNFFWDYWTGEGLGNKSSLAWAGFWSGWAYLAHPTALFYIVGMGIFAWWHGRGKARLAPTPLFPISYFLFPAFIVLLPWHLWVVYQYGPWTLITANPSWAHQSAAGWGEALGIRLVNFVGNLFSFWLVEGLGGMFSPAVSLGRRLYLLYSGFLRYYNNVLPGALTTTVSWLLLYYLFKTEKVGAGLKPAPTIPFAGLIQKFRSLKDSPQPLGFFLFIQVLCGFWGMVLAQPYKVAEGITAQGMAPVVIILLLLGAYLLDSLEPKLKMLAAGAVILEFLLVRGSHLALLQQGFLGRAGDRNLALKQDYGLVFPADILGAASWFFWLLLGALWVITAGSFLTVQKTVDQK